MALSPGNPSRVSKTCGERRWPWCKKGLPSDFFPRALLQQNGMDAADIDYIDMETAQAGAAFLAGDLDAAVAW